MIFNNIDAAQNEANKPKKDVDKIRSKQKSIDDDFHDNIEEIVVAGDKMIPADSKRKSIASISNIKKDSIADDDDEDEEGLKKLDGDLIKVSLEQNNYGLGISLAGRIKSFSRIEAKIIIWFEGFTHKDHKLFGYVVEI